MSQQSPVLVKVGISGVDIDGAMRNLDADIPGWDFDGRQQAADAWERELSRIRVQTSSKRDLRVFYSSLYHTMLAPTLFQRCGWALSRHGPENPSAARRPAQLQHVFAVGYLPRASTAVDVVSGRSRARFRQRPWCAWPKKVPTVRRCGRCKASKPAA
jgi:hypothetical protein